MAKYKITDNFPHERCVVTPYGTVCGFVSVAYTDNKEAADYLANNGIHCGGVPKFTVEEIQEDIPSTGEDNQEGPVDPEIPSDAGSTENTDDAAQEGQEAGV